MGTHRRRTARKEEGVPLMTQVITVEQAAARLSAIIHSLGRDEEIVLTENNAPVARLRPSIGHRPRRAGNCKGMLVVVQEDDEHLRDFGAYIA